MRTLHIIMPMAGEGSRFVKEGWKIPKPLIVLNDLPLFMRAINSVNIEGVNIRHSFIVREEHIKCFKIDEQIKSQLPNANIFTVAETTRGAVETCLIAEPVINPDEAIIVMDCDLEFSSKSFNNNIKKILNKPTEIVNGGLLVSFNSDLPKYSYAEVDENYIVKRTAEKEVISNHALCGAYFFSSSVEFIKIAHQLIDDVSFDKPEFYVSLLYNYMIKAGDRIMLCPMEKYYSYGTPEELKKYL